MNVLLEEKKYTDSAQVAIEVMLQEFNENQITMVMGLLSCWKYINEVVQNANAIIETPESEANVNSDVKPVRFNKNFL